MKKRGEYYRKKGEKNKKTENLYYSTKLMENFSEE